MKRGLFDIEGNGLLYATDDAPECTMVHCIVVTDIDTGETWDYKPDEVDEGVEKLRSFDELWAANGLRYDYPVLEKLKGLILPFRTQRDLLVASRVKHPNIKETDGKLNASRRAKKLPTMPPEYFGSHTVGAWGYRLGVPKLHEDITDWSQWTPEMHERCIGDVATSLKWFKFLQVDKIPEAVLKLEHEIAHVAEQITQAGWPFDEKAAADLHVKLVERRDVIERELKAEFLGWYVNKGLFTPKKDNKRLGYVAGAQCSKIEWVDFKPSSNPHVEKKLREFGWEPVEFTDSGNFAKLDEEVLENVAILYPQSRGLVEYRMITKRLGQLANGDRAWMKLVRNGKIHAAYNTMGAVTSRATHFGPNIAQTPAAAAPYGSECRALFTVPDGWEMVGADQDGLELRGLGHYLAKYDDGAFADAVLEGDPHWGNVVAFGFVDAGTERDKHDQLHTIFREAGAKRGIYALVYGAGNEQMGVIILDALRLAMKEDPERARPIFARFFRTESPDKRAIIKVGKKAKQNLLKGLGALGVFVEVMAHILAVQDWIPGLDKRRVPVRSEHAVINFAVQSCGAILCKRWVVNSYRALLAAGFKWGWDGDFVFLGWIHDEVQIACRVGLGDRIGEIVTREARRAGEPYGFRVRLDSKYKIGRTWADTH